MANQFVLPEIIAEVIAEKLGDKIKLYPLAKVEGLDGKAGQVVKVPQVEYIGAAEDVPAGSLIPVSDFVQSAKTAEIKKAGKAIKFTQEDLNNHFLNLGEQAEIQLTKAIADKIEADLFDELKKATLTANVDALSVDGLADAVVPFGEDLDDPMYLFVNPADLAALRKDPAFVVNASHGNAVVGSAGMIFNMEVVVSNKVDAGSAFIIKEEAVAIYLRKDVEVEVDKDIMTQTHAIVATAHYVAMLNDASKAIKVVIGG